MAKAIRFETEKAPAIPRGNQSDPCLLYIHIPFCERLCPYCSFHRIQFDARLCREYFQALRREIVLYKEQGHDFKGIYVGGGTPTVMIDELAETLGLARQCFRIDGISVETNPDHLTDDRLVVLRQAGVNRLSVGVQSFDDGLLKSMQRFDKYGSGETIAGRLKDVLGRFDTLNADMMFNFPSQTERMLERDLQILTGMAMDQVTWYPLMASDATRRRVREVFGRVDYNQERQFYGRIVSGLVPPYRFSSAWCFSWGAAMVDEYIVNYDTYAGLGSGAIGYLNGTCYANTFLVPEYIERLRRGELPLIASRNFSIRDRMRYDFLMRLFSTTLDPRDLSKKYGRSIIPYLGVELLALLVFGRLYRDGGIYHLTARGRYAWVIMMREFFIAVNNFRDFCRSEAGLPLAA
jgi:coproporphyrinogen III oxidase-like Fe-S oxidoreductase